MDQKERLLADLDRVLGENGVLADYYINARFGYDHHRRSYLVTILVVDVPTDTRSPYEYWVERWSR